MSETAVDHAGFWAGTERHELRLQRCRDCARLRWYPTPRCPHCHSTATEWTPIEPTGRLYSWSIVHHALLPAFAARAPYAIVLVELDVQAGIRLLGNGVDTDAERLRVGLPMTAVFTEAEGRTLVNWRAAEEP